MGVRSISRPRRIALAFPIRFGHMPIVVKGITDYTEQKNEWIFTTSAESFNFSVRSMRGWRGDGAIVVLNNEDDAAAAQQLGIPVVTVGWVLRSPGVPRVHTDNYSIGKLAADHLLSCRFKHFGYYGIADVAYSEDRLEGFRPHVENEGSSVNVYLSPNTFKPEQPWEDEIDKLSDWLRGLPLPVGVFAVNDQRARLVTEACQMLGLRVPADVGVIGVDNDRLFCELASPPLSSVACDYRRVGYEVAKLLDAVMAGKPDINPEVILPPLGIVARQSTDVLHVEHPAVVKAIDFIRKNIGKVFGVDALPEATGVSRRRLERDFMEAMNITPYHFICNAKVNHAKKILRDYPDRKLAAVASACGFPDLRNFRNVFRRVEGLSPADYRANVQLSDIPVRPEKIRQEK
jgi:LacI family transcriptional regulator